VTVWQITARSDSATLPIILAPLNEPQRHKGHKGHKGQ
jgi:hypothetical protein